MAHDYSEFTKDDTKLDPSKLASLVKLIELMGEEQENVARIEEELKTAQGRLIDLSDYQIPETMDICGLTKFETSDKVEVQVKETIRASVPVDGRQRAWDWLEDNGHGAMIKRTVSVAFNRDQQDEAKDLLEGIRGKFQNVKEEKKVEIPTLKAWIKERLKNGESVDMDMFGAFNQRRAHLKDKSK